MTPGPDPADRLVWVLPLHRTGGQALGPSDTAARCAELAIEPDPIRRLWDAVDRAAEEGVTNAHFDGVPDPDHPLTFHAVRGGYAAGDDDVSLRAAIRAAEVVGHAFLLLGTEASPDRPAATLAIERSPVSLERVRRHVTGERVHWTAFSPTDDHRVRTSHVSRNELAHAALYTDDAALIRRGLVSLARSHPLVVLSLLEDGIFPDLGPGSSRRVPATLISADTLAPLLSHDWPHVRERAFRLLGRTAGGPDRPTPAGRRR